MSEWDFQIVVVFLRSGVVSYLMCAFATEAFAVRLFDRTLHVALTDDGVGEWNVVGETATPDHKIIERKNE